MKEELINHLKNKNIKCVMSLWANTKDFYNEKNIKQGGSYGSINDYISVAIKIDDAEELVRFKVSLNEI